jgi:hypothetical protein
MAKKPVAKKASQNTVKKAPDKAAPPNMRKGTLASAYLYEGTHVEEADLPDPDEVWEEADHDIGMGTFD